MFIADLGQIKEVTARVPVRAVGWLETGEPFAQGQVSEEVYRRLVELLRDPWQPFVAAGSHACSLCRFDAEAHGTKNLFVLTNETIYCCPELITHYINAHGYCPPREFCEAVLTCPDTRSMDYKRMLVRLGVKPDLKSDHGAGR